MTYAKNSPSQKRMASLLSWTNVVQVPPLMVTVPSTSSRNWWFFAVAEGAEEGLEGVLAVALPRFAEREVALVHAFDVERGEFPPLGPAEVGLFDAGFAEVRLGGHDLFVEDPQLLECESRRILNSVRWFGRTSRR